MTTQVTSFDSMLWPVELSAELESTERSSEIDCDPVTHASCTLIQTSNSFYLFRVTNPGERRGLLVGGAVGECPANAMLVGSLPVGNDAAGDACEDRPAVRVGARAVFLIEKNGACKCVITSRVVGLAHAPIRAREALAANH